MIQHARVVEVSIGALTALPGLAAAQLTSLDGIATVLGICSVLWGAAVGFLFYWVQALIRRREDERKAEEHVWRKEVEELLTVQTNQLAGLKEQLNEKTLKLLLEIGEKYAQRTDILTQIGRVESKADAAHHRLDKGADSLADHDRRLAVLEAHQRSGRFRRDETGRQDGA